MLRLHLDVLDGSDRLCREHISAWIYTKLSSKYHDAGLAEYCNGDGVKGHTFTFNKVKEYVKGNLLFIDLRGLEQVENVFKSRLLLGEEIVLGSLLLKLIYIEEVAYVIKKDYLIKSPIILRVSNKREDLFNLVEHKNNPVLTPEESLEFWEEEITRLIINRANLIYGEYLDGLTSVSVVDYKITRERLTMKGKSLVYKCTLGRLEIVGEPFWHDFIQRVGLGNRNSYGFGVIG